MILNRQSQSEARAALISERNSIEQPKIFSTDIVESAIALLSDPEIAEMPREDMLEVVQIVQTRRPKTNRQIVSDLDDANLRRVLLLLRRSLRTMIDFQSRSRGWLPYFGELA